MNLAPRKPQLVATISVMTAFLLHACGGGPRPAPEDTPTPTPPGDGDRPRDADGDARALPNADPGKHVPVGSRHRHELAGSVPLSRRLGTCLTA